MSRLTAMSAILPLAILPLAILVGCDADSPAGPEADAWSDATVALAPNANANPNAQQAAGRGLVRTEWPTAQDPGMPFYTRIEPAPPHVYSDGGWVGIVFYREPACVPGGFNLLEFFDAPAAFGCPHTVAGHSLWQVEFGAGAPQLVVAQGSSVPVWFVPEQAMMYAMADNVLTIGEIEGLPGLMKGVAGSLQETLHPHPLPPQFGGGGHRVPKMILDARGTLEDGRDFSLHITNVNDGRQNIRIRIN